MLGSFHERNGFYSQLRGHARFAAGAKFCTGCGTQLAAGAKFCSGCGTPAEA